MDIDALFASPWGALLIFLARILDVSIDTMRVLFAIRGRRGYAAILGGFQAVIWIFAVGNAVKHLDSVLHIVGYAAGYATGTFVGVTIEGLVAYGVAMLRVVSSQGGDAIARSLRDHGYGVTELQGRGREGDVAVVMAVVERGHLGEVMDLVHEIDEAAFMTVEEPTMLRGGRVRTREWPVPNPMSYFERFRKGG